MLQKSTNIRVEELSHDVVHDTSMVHALGLTPEVWCHLNYGGLLKMAECLAARLSAQEEQIRLLTKEISSLRDGLSRGLDTVEITDVSPELECLRAENEKLRYRLVHLRRGLQAELQREEGPGRKQPGNKCGKAAEKNASKVQQKNNCPQNKVALMIAVFLITISTPYL